MHWGNEKNVDSSFFSEEMWVRGMQDSRWEMGVHVGRLRDLHVLSRIFMLAGGGSLHEISTTPLR